MTGTQAQSATPLSNAQFHDAVLELHPAVAVFDCDGTLWSADAGYGFMVWSLESGLVSRDASDWIDSRYRAYRKGEVSEEAMCGEMVQVYAGLRESEIRKAAAHYFHKYIEPEIFPEIAALIAELNRSGVELWAVSSTNKWVIEEGMRSFGIPPAGIPVERTLCARVRVDNGVITSDLIDVPTGPGKVAALARAGVHSADAVFGNSVHDAAMLDLARRPFAVNPSPALLEMAARRNWPVFYPEFR